MSTLESYLSEHWAPGLALGVVFFGVTLSLTVADLGFSWTFYDSTIIEYYEKRSKLTPSVLWNCGWIVLRNMLVTGLFVGFVWTLRFYTLGSFHLNVVSWGFEWCRSLSSWTDVQPLKGFLTLVETILTLALLNFLSQTWFYHAHRACHKSRDLFLHVHAKHHEYSEPFAIVAIYCTVAEMVFLNMPAVFLPVWILLPHRTISIVWYILVGIYTPVSHSGHDVLGWVNAKYHDLHHRMFYCNFGSTFWDNWYGTQCKKLDE